MIELLPDLPDKVVGIIASGQVTDIDWVAGATRILGFAMPCPLRFFPPMISPKQHIGFQQPNLTLHSDAKGSNTTSKSTQTRMENVGQALRVPRNLSIKIEKRSR
jgi:hypothetical protein